ncbi:MAG: phosphoethanolamine--lipid A transferase [Methyloligellaceae bacterium]
MNPERKRSLPERSGLTLSPAGLILSVSLFLTLFANTGFFSSVAATYPPGAGNLAFLGSLVVFVAASFVLTFAILCHGFLTRPVLIIFLLSGAVIAYFMNEYGVVVDEHMLQNVIETDVREARDLLTPKLLLYLLFLGLLPSLAVYKTKIRPLSLRAGLLSRLRIGLVSLAALVIVFAAFSSQYISLFRVHKELRYRINPAHALFSAARLAKHSLQAVSTHFIVGADAKIPEADTHRELVIFVVGETARADHFSLNGYHRETNPLLKREKVVNFPDFWSCGTSTADSVPCMFSHLTRSSFDRQKALAADNVLDILKRAGVSILWRDNNSSSKGVADRVRYEGFQSPDINPVCDLECRDEGMLAGLQEFIDAHAQGDILIVLHQMGNHGPAYYKRYPPAFEKFTPVCRTSELSKCSTAEIVNAYDNAILYTDYFLSRAIALLKQNDSRFETALFYVSDHGESLGENGIFLHGLPYFLAPDAQKHVPALMWFGRNFDHESTRKLHETRLRRLSHDNIFATLIGLFEVRSDAYDPEMDILDHDYPAHW